MIIDFEALFSLAFLERRRRGGSDFEEGINDY
jgi:hypothetical protein